LSRSKLKPSIPAALEAEEFMALLLHAQSNPCECVFAQYFKRIGERMVKQHIRSGEHG